MNATSYTFTTTHATISEYALRDEPVDIFMQDDGRCRAHHKLFGTGDIYDTPEDAIAGLLVTRHQCEIVELVQMPINRCVR